MCTDIFILSAFLAHSSNNDIVEFLCVTGEQQKFLWWSNTITGNERVVNLPLISFRVHLVFQVIPSIVFIFNYNLLFFL